MNPLADTLAELAADPPTTEQIARFSERYLALQAAHRHIGRLSKLALVTHVGRPHPNGYNATPATELEAWSREELDDAHDRLHEGER